MTRRTEVPAADAVVLVVMLIGFVLLCLSRLA